MEERSDDQPTMFRIEERKDYLVLLIDGKVYPNEYPTRERAERAAEAIAAYWKNRGREWL